jgi:oligoribonuclease
MDLYWLDLETTGLHPETDKILEVAIYKATLEDPFNLQFVYEKVLNFTQADTLNDFVKDMHTKNGLLEACLRSSDNIELVQNDLLNLIPTSEDRKSMPVLAGSSIHFDASFIKLHMPTLYSRFSHRQYDVSAIKLFCQSLGMSEFKKAEAHRAKDDIQESVAHAKECAEWLKTNLK